MLVLWGRGERHFPVLVNYLLSRGVVGEQQVPWGKDSIEERINPMD